jgi:hypothetical protein
MKTTIVLSNFFTVGSLQLKQDFGWRRGHDRSGKIIYFIEQVNHLIFANYTNHDFCALSRTAVTGFFSFK